VSPAAREGRCECCHSAYSAGDLVVWDSVGLVLAQRQQPPPMITHISAFVQLRPFGREPRRRSPTRIYSPIRNTR